MYKTKQLHLDETRTRWNIEPLVAIMLEAYRDSPLTLEHAGRVALYAVAFGRKIGIRGEDLMSLHCAALLHEVGKLLLAAELLGKATQLDRDEWFSITKHTTLMIRKLKQYKIPANIMTILQSHSERYDGSGYPLALAADEIPLASRVLSIADAYDTMANDRPYRPAHSHPQMLAEFSSGSGTQFDPDILRKVQPLLEAGSEAMLPTRSIRLISRDAGLYRQLWFAALPHGWHVQLWSGEAAPARSIPLDTALPDPNPSTLTIIDSQFAEQLSGETLVGLQADAVWVGNPDPSRPTLERPLDLRDVLALLYSNAREEWSGTPVPKIRAVLADPYHVFRQVLRRYLDGLNDIEVIAEVSSPGEYRDAISAHNFDIIIVASDLLSGTHTTSPLKNGDLRLDQALVITGPLDPQPTIVLVADEDADDYKVGLYDAPLPGKMSNIAYIHRGAPAERLVEAIKTMVKPQERVSRK